MSDGQFDTLKEIIAAICQALGRTPPRFSVPAAPTRFFAGLMEDALRLVGQKSPISRDTIDDDLVKSLDSRFFVIPAKAGIQ